MFEANKLPLFWKELFGVTTKILEDLLVIEMKNTKIH